MRRGIARVEPQRPLEAALGPLPVEILCGFHVCERRVRLGALIVVIFLVVLAIDGISVWARTKLI